MLKVPADVIIQLEMPGRWVISNLFSRTCIGAELGVVELLGEIGNQDYTASISQYEQRSFRVWEIEYFSNYEGLLADPTRRIRHIADWPEPEELDIQQLLKKLQERFILIEHEKEYRARFAPKTSLVDAAHFGNFHQQLGWELLGIRRENPEDWWVAQKFAEDFSSVRNNLYGAVQASSLEQYFHQKISPGAAVIDIGCGIGFYSNMIAQAGATVLGIDPNEKYINIARHRSVENTRFELFDVGTKDAMDKIPSESADIIFMSDALLFYFVPEKPSQTADIQVLLSDIHRILKPDGIFINLEPHYVFWLQPWLGEEQYPFTVLTEYMNKTFGVTPTLSQLIQTYTKAGFAITWMEEFLPEPTFETIDRRAYYFARQFPLWHLFELKPV